MLSTRLFSTLRSVKVMELKEVVKKLNQFAPTSLAEKWDNVGLLIEPSSPLQVYLNIYLFTNKSYKDERLNIF